MQITSSYSVEIRKQDLCFRKTFEVYRSAAAYLIPVFDSVWENWKKQAAQSGALMPRSTSSTVRKRIPPALILTCVFLRCRLT